MSSGVPKNVPLTHNQSSKVACLVLYPNMRLFYGQVERFKGKKIRFCGTPDSYVHLRKDTNELFLDDQMQIPLSRNQNKIDYKRG